jgi:mannose/fructose-specific phosphotransferase system component IIA
MSDSGVRGIVIAHGEMATGMIDAVKHIAGVTGDFLVPLSNRGLGPEALAQEVRRLASAEPTIVFTDLQSGSCGFAARRCVQDMPQLVVISGVNLPILLEFVMRRQLPLDQLVPFLLAKGRSAINCSPATFETNEHRAVSRG